jgi:hypothetical protein
MAETVLAWMRALDRELESELPPVRDAHEVGSGHEALLRQRIERNRRQLLKGFDLEEATDPRLGDLVRHPVVAGLRLRRPCIESVTALIEQLRQEAAGEVARAKMSGATWPQLRRLKTQVQIDPRSKPVPAGPHVHEGRLVLPGEEVLLTEEQSIAFADKFEPVTS